MIPDKHTWVCATCGQGLTRKSTAVRHNNNLHSGSAILVRPYDYIIGRLNGKFLPSDPSLFRRNNRNQQNEYDSIHRQHDENNRMGFRTVPGNAGHERGYGNVSKQSTNFNDAIGTPSPFLAAHKLAGAKAPDAFEKWSDRILKLKEFEILAKKHYHPETAKQMIIVAGMQANQEDDYHLDKNIAFLRNMDRARSY